jgi:pSer/pThr/pTyr-binding forkhead associated (FHA) protein
MVSDSSQGSPAGVSDASSESDERRPTLDVENPWPGLAAYDEASRDFFHGREREAQELLRLIRLAPLTTLYSKSGLGKSSLLQAGLFPLLREQHFLPVYLRIDFSDGATDPLEQVALRLEAELARAEAEYPVRHGETLWRYLHREPLEIWSKDNFPLVPVLVFDQFEEMFLHRGSDPKRVEELRNSLADLIENRIPAELATDAAKPERSQLSLLSLHYRIVLSCREDFLPDLKSWEADVPSLLRNYLRLEPMTRQCAIEAVEASGGTVLAEGVAPLIVDFVGTIDERPNSSAEAVIEPVLLSLCCHQLNRRRKAGEKINKALVDRAGRDILDNFYQTALADKDVKGLPDVATFIETHLIQGERFRGDYPKAEAIKEGLLAQTQLDALTNRHRLLRVVQHTDTARIELIHDRMVEVVCRARNERKIRERQAEQERQAAEAARRSKKRLRAAAGVIALTLLAAGYFFHSSFTQWEETRAWATLDSAASGRRYPLQQDVANIGRPTKGMDLIYQVALLNRAVSRIHLMIFQNFNAIDVRSLYGTTVNGEFLQYGQQAGLESGDVIVLGGVAAFVFHPLTYRAWQYFARTPLSDEAPPPGWALLIDGKRRLVFPLTQDEVFIAPAGDSGIEPRDRPEGAIAVVRRRDVDRVEISWSRATAELLDHRPEDPGTAEVDVFAFTPPGARGHSRELNTTFLTIEDVADGQPLEAEIKLDDYTYGRFVLPEAQQNFLLRSTRGVRDHSLTELAFHQGGRRFQVIWRDPRIESPPRDKSP